MNVSRTFSNSGVSRRAFVRTLGIPSSGAVLTHWMIRRALLTRNFTGNAVTVYKMVPLPGYRYSNADLAHMANKIFPSIEAARRCRTHPAVFYGLKPVSLPRSVTNGLDGHPLF